jgi:septum formation protein
MKLPKIILASASPRRAEILKSVGWEFEKNAADIDESEHEGELAIDYVKRLATEKAKKVASKYDNALVLGADTTVVLDGQIIGKPTNLSQARSMLKLLSGKWHEVLTAVAIIKKRGSQSQIVSGVEKTNVKFAVMSDQEIDFLVNEGNPLDKAGAYAVQAQAALFIERIEGDYWNVVGLPIRLVYCLVGKLEFSSSEADQWSGKA